MATLISDKFSAWKLECESRFQQLKTNEEELNRHLRSAGRADAGSSRQRHYRT